MPLVLNCEAFFSLNELEALHRCSASAENSRSPRKASHARGGRRLNAFGHLSPNRRRAEGGEEVAVGQNLRYLFGVGKATQR